MTLYPIHLDLQDKRCVVVGAGKVAERKVQRLCESDALVHIVAPHATPTLEQSAAAGQVTWVRAEYRAGHLADAFLVIAATNHAGVNAAVTRDAQERGLLVCRADDWRGGNFVSPAAITRGELLITLFTGGGSPTLAAVLRQDFEKLLGPEWAELTAIMETLRPVLKAVGDENARQAAVRRIIDDVEVRAALRDGHYSEAEARARQCLSLSWA